MGRKFKEEGIYVYVWLIHFSVQQKITHIVKQLYYKKIIASELGFGHCFILHVPFKSKISVYYSPLILL